MLYLGGTQKMYEYNSAPKGEEKTERSGDSKNLQHGLEMAFIIAPPLQ